MISFDESRRPLIRVTMTGTLSKAEVDVYHAHLTKVLNDARTAGLKVGLTVDGRDSSPPSADVRKVFADYLASYEHLMVAGAFGSTIVVSNALQRGVLTALLWFRPLPVPYVVATTPEEGERWLANLERAT